MLGLLVLFTIFLCVSCNYYNGLGCKVYNIIYHFQICFNVSYLNQIICQFFNGVS